MRIIELSEPAYDEIEDKLIAAGFDYLVWPRGSAICLDGFRIVRHVPEDHIAHHPV